MTRWLQFKLWLLSLPLYVSAWLSVDPLREDR